MTKPTEPVSKAVSLDETTQDPEARRQDVTPVSKAASNPQTQDTDTGAAQTSTMPPGDVTADSSRVALVGEGRARAREVRRRLLKEGRWEGRIELERDEMMAAARAKGMTHPEAQAWTYSELDRLYPPDGGLSKFGQTGSGATKGVADSKLDIMSNLNGLADIPGEWGELPSNAPLAVELAWVQSERLRVVGGTSAAPVVSLANASASAPSWSALGWLETSVRAYAKYVDVVAKVSGTATDEAELVRRERLQLDEVRELLGEMLDAE